MVYYIPSILGEIGVLLFNLFILFYLAKNDGDADQWNKNHRIKKAKRFNWYLILYFISWIITSLFAWHLNFIHLGEFFAVAVVLPVFIIMFAKWMFF